MAPWKRTMPTIVLLLLGSISTNVQADITKTPTSGVFLEGSDVTLNCVVEGNDNVIWEDFREATEIFVGKDKNTEKKKYDNFEISSGDEDFSLIIKDVHLSDEGTYICKDRDQHPNATVTIGVLPYVYLSVKQSEATQASQTSTEVNITCSAYNARPAVSVFELSVIGSEKMVNITNDKSNQNEDEKTYNSSAPVSYIMSSEEMSVYCRVFTAGRSIKHTENFYKPRCNITMSGIEIRCLCQANPQVKSYYMDVNGNNHDGDVLFIEEDDPMNIRCFARNELGTGQSDLLFPDDIYGFSLVPISVIVSVVVLLVVLTVIYIRHRLGPRDKKSDEEQSQVHDTNDEESASLLSRSNNKLDEAEKQKNSEEEQSQVQDTNYEESASLLSQSNNKLDETEKQKNSEEEQSQVHDTNDEESASPLSQSETKSDKKEQPEDTEEKQPKVHGANEEESVNLLPQLENRPDEKGQQEDAEDPQKFISKILLQVNKDWEIFAIEVLNISDTVVEEAVMTNDNFKDQINAVTENMTSYHIEVFYKNAHLCKQFGFDCVKDNNGCFLQRINNTQADPREQDPTYISSSENILDCCGTRIGKVGISKLLEAFEILRIEADDGASLLKTLEQEDLIKKPYVNLLRDLTECKMYGARKILLSSFKTDVKQLEATLRNHVKKDWEIFAIEILDIPAKVVLDAVQNYDTYEDQIEVVIKEITAEHIGIIDDIKTHNNMDKTQLLSEFNLQYVEEEGRHYFRNMESLNSEKSSDEEIICQQDPPTIESRGDMLKLCRERIGKAGIRRLLAELAICDIETEDETNVLEKLDNNGVIDIDCANLLSNLSDCNLFRARKIVCAYLVADLWNYITSDLCPQISLDWEIFAVEVLKLEIDHVLDIIEHANDEKGQILSMFRKWRSICGQQEKFSKPFLQDLIKYNELSGKIMSKDNRLKDVPDLKVKPTNKGDCSEEFLAILTTCCKRIGVVGSKRLAEITSKGGLRKFLVATGVVGTSAEAPEGISVDDSVESLGRLCLMLNEANLFTARDVVITYIENKLHKVIATISKERASDWDEFAQVGLHLSDEDIVYIVRTDKSNEERVRMSISRWMRRTNIDEYVENTLKKMPQKI